MLLAKRLKGAPAISHVTAMLRITWSLGRVYCLAYVALRLVAAVVPLGQLWIGKLIIELIVAAQSGRLIVLSQLATLVVAEFLLLAVMEASARLTTWVDTVLADRFSVHINSRILEHAAALDLRTVECASFQDALERARGQASSRLSVLTSLFQNIQQAMTFSSLLAAVLVVGPWVVIVQAAGIFPMLIVENRSVRERYAMVRSTSQTRRRLEYLLTLGTGLDAAKELRTCGLASHLRRLYRRTAEAYLELHQALTRRRLTSLTWLSLFSPATYYWIRTAGMAGGGRWPVTVGEFVFLAGALQRCKSDLVGISGSVNRTTEAVVEVGDLFRFFETQSASVSRADHSRPRRQSMRRGLDVDNVSFVYPGHTRPALQHVSFCVNDGECLALVGENACGKSTLVKLLCRLYDPTEGQILLDGVDLRSVESDELRRLITVVFQDYVRFDLPVRENIGFGSIERVDDLEAVRTAASRAGVLHTIEGLPAGFEQVLGRRFEGGRELSGGQWQRIALARACMHRGRLAVFDEPTAALDPRAEHAVFRDLADLTRDRMAVMVSHRMTGTRVADRILVLSDGRVVEDGDHASLLARGGDYAELVELHSIAREETPVVHERQRATASI